MLINFFFFCVITRKQLFKIRIARKLLSNLLRRTESWTVTSSSRRFLRNWVLNWLVILLLGWRSQLWLVHIILKLNSSLSCLGRIVLVKFKHMLVKRILYIFHQISSTCWSLNFNWRFSALCIIKYWRARGYSLWHFNCILIIIIGEFVFLLCCRVCCFKRRCNRIDCSCWCNFLNVRCWNWWVWLVNWDDPFWYFPLMILRWPLLALVIRGSCSSCCERSCNLF